MNVVFFTLNHVHPEVRQQHATSTKTARRDHKLIQLAILVLIVVVILKLLKVF